MDSKIEEWLKDINPDFSINDGVCNIIQKDLNIEFSLFFVSENYQLTVIGPFHNINDGHFNGLLERALIDNANAKKMEGCWISLIDNKLVLSHSRDISSLDQIGFTNLMYHFSSKIDQLKKEYSTQNQVGETINLHNLIGTLA